MRTTQSDLRIGPILALGTARIWFLKPSLNSPTRRKVTSGASTLARGSRRSKKQHLLGLRVSHCYPSAIVNLCWIRPPTSRLIFCVPTFACVAPKLLLTRLSSAVAVFDCKFYLQFLLPVLGVVKTYGRCSLLSGKKEHRMRDRQTITYCWWVSSFNKSPRRSCGSPAALNTYPLDGSPQPGSTKQP